MLARVDRRLAGAGLLGLLVLAVPARVERIQVWSTAVSTPRPSATAWWRSTRTRLSRSCSVRVPIVRWNVAAMIDHSNVLGALSLAYGTEDLDVLLPIDDPDAWYAASVAERFDLRAASRLDDLDVMTG